ncbi:MAG: D-glycero-beta-D-manno-heptose 1-phosphate adenylyltransferase [Candidatus Omnitrophica bacterium]|nr:D-glycero-beta-D-manno-heptose 1-phosphate adenylyltransferase [Candidatus Omnitrophota bacterium]
MTTYQKKIKTIDQIKQLAETFRSQKKRIVFTNGCFDLLHLGHVRYLTEAKDKGDVLIVGVNSDQSVKRLKGQNRPITPQDARCEVLAALTCIDYLTIFDDDTPLELIEMIHPDVLVKGGDWLPENIVGSEHVSSYGGRVITIPYLQGFSSSEIIKKINIDG